MSYGSTFYLDTVHFQLCTFRAKMNIVTYFSTIYPFLLIHFKVRTSKIWHTVFFNYSHLFWSPLFIRTQCIFTQLGCRKTFRTSSVQPKNNVLLCQSWCRFDDRDPVALLMQRRQLAVWPVRVECGRNSDSNWLSNTIIHQQVKSAGFPFSCSQKISELFPYPRSIFPGLCRSPAMLNYRQTATTYSVYTVWQYNTLQYVHHKLQRNCSVSVQQEYFIHLFTHCVLYIKAWVG